MLSCYDTELCYDHQTDSFRARYCYKRPMLRFISKDNPSGGRVFSLFVEVVFFSCTAAIPILYLKK